MRKQTVCVVGLGYIGLPTAALLAHNDFKVYGVDLNEDVVATIRGGGVHIVEPELEGYVRDAVLKGLLEVSTTVVKADIYMICVPTPFHIRPGIPQPNIDYVLTAANSIAEYLDDGSLVILESTSPVGTTKEILRLFTTLGLDQAKLNIAYCPERVLPGRIIKELVENDRIVGGINLASTKLAADFYRQFVKGDVLETNAETAEMCKLAENSFRDVNIAFANELSILSDKAGVNVWELIALANRHPRVNILQPGVGVGGHCIAVDPWFLVAQDPENARLIKVGREVNQFKSDWVLNKIKKQITDYEKKNGVNPKIACLGLAFKPNIDDLRESPAVGIVEKLLIFSNNVSVVEPNIQSHHKFQLTNLEAAVASSDLLIALVGHKEFIGLENRIAGGKKILMDFCSLANC